MPPSQRIKIDRKSLREPDEFQTLTTQAAAWATQHQNTLWGVGIALVAIALIGLGIGWYRARQAEAAAVRFQSAHAEFLDGKYPAAAESFAGLGRDYGSTPFGRLAQLYRGHALLRGGDAAGAATAYGEYLAGSPETVRRGLEAFIARTGADELMSTSQIFDHAARLRSYELTAQVRDQLARPDDSLSPAV